MHNGCPLFGDEMTCTSKVKWGNNPSTAPAEALGNYARGLWDEFRRDPGNPNCLKRIAGGSASNGSPPPTSFFSGLVGGQRHIRINDTINGVASQNIPSSRSYRFRWTGANSKRVYIAFRNADTSTLRATLYVTGNALQPVDTSPVLFGTFYGSGNDLQYSVNMAPGYWYYVYVVATGGGIGSGTRQLTLEVETYA